MTWAQLVVLCMVESDGSVTANIVRNWIAENRPSRYEMSTTVAAVFHSSCQFHAGFVSALISSKGAQPVKCEYECAGGVCIAANQTGETAEIVGPLLTLDIGYPVLIFKARCQS
jgi:hypothetical protein